MQLERHVLTAQWQWKARTSDLSLHDDFVTDGQWSPAVVPGCIHQDLLAAQRIPDPYWGLNETEVQWVGETDWLYRCSFTVADSLQGAPCLDLCFAGLDTFAQIWLNGQFVLRSDNMFLAHRISIDHLVHMGHNDLWICFESAWRHGKQREMHHEPLLDTPWVGDNSRFFVRKAQYHYGWDWGPKLLTAGVWRPVTLEAYEARISATQSTVQLAADLGTASVALETQVTFAPLLDKDDTATYAVEMALYDPTGVAVWQHVCPIADGVARATAVLDAPALWWPLQLGGQPLYRVTATLVKHGATSRHQLDTYEHHFGIRRVVLKQEPSPAGGASFAFEVNNVPLFCGGANWIPADMLLARVTPAAYRDWVRLAADANMVMLRVWGGGIYEHDAFYDACDEMGILVWQDFMFACGMYPGQAWFLDSVRAEAEAQVHRLRHHPSIVLWCGNNEDYQVAARMGVYDPAFEGDHTHSRFPAREIYERLLPEVCDRLDPTRAYWPGSPYGGLDANSNIVGDQHLWSVWHDPMHDFHDYPQLGGRFVSEFGLASLPALSTIASFTPPHERQPQSRVIEFHNRSVDGARRLAVYLNDTLQAPEDLARYSYATQVVQAEALATALLGWRRRWNVSTGDDVAGGLLWQLNDCWPGTSWAIIDYYKRPKPAYYAVKRALAALSSGAARQPDGTVAAWAINATRVALPAHVTTQEWRLDGTLIEQHEWVTKLDATHATEVGMFRPRSPESIFVITFACEGQPPTRSTVWPEPYKYVQFPDPQVQLYVYEHDRLTVTVQRPVKGLWLVAEDCVQWEDNYLDLMSGETRIIHAPGLTASKVMPHVEWLR